MERGVSEVRISHVTSLGLPAGTCDHSAAAAAELRVRNTAAG